MKQKEKIMKAYQRENGVETFDSTRSSTYGQRWHNDYEKDLVINSIKELKNNELKILDVACGTGRFVQDLFKTKKEIEYHGIDTSKAMLKKLKDRMKGKLINLYCQDASKLPFKDKTFDISYSFHLLWHIEKSDQIKIIKEMMRVTKDGGIIIIDAYNKDFFYDKIRKKRKYPDGYEVFKLSIKEIKKILKPLKEIEIFGILDPHIDNKFVFDSMTFVPNKILKKQHYLHHMIYFKIKK